MCLLNEKFQLGSTAFLLRENRRHVTGRRPDGRAATLNAAPYGGPHNNTRVQRKMALFSIKN